MTLPRKASTEVASSGSALRPLARRTLAPRILAHRPVASCPRAEEAAVDRDIVLEGRSGEGIHAKKSLHYLLASLLGLLAPG